MLDSVGQGFEILSLNPLYRKARILLWAAEANKSMNVAEFPKQIFSFVFKTLSPCHTVQLPPNIHCLCFPPLYCTMTKTILWSCLTSSPPILFFCPSWSLIAVRSCGLIGKCRQKFSHNPEGGGNGNWLGWKLLTMRLYHQTLGMTLMGCSSVSVVELAGGGSAINGATLINFIDTSQYF